MKPAILNYVVISIGSIFQNIADRRRLSISVLIDQTMVFKTFIFKSIINCYGHIVIISSMEPLFL